MEGSAPQSGWSYWLLTLVLLLIPFWLPFVYGGAVVLEMKLTKHGPLNEGALFFLFVAPVIGTVPIILRKSLPVAAKAVLVPAYYLVGLTVSFFIGWGVAISLFGP